MRSAIAILILSAGLTGCAGMNYLAENYGTMKPTVVASAGDEWWVYDKPGQNKILVQRNPASGAAQGFIGGLTFNPNVAAAPKPYYQQAAETHLRQAGRRCRIKDGYLIIEPSWEFTYECEA